MIVADRDNDGVHVELHMFMRSTNIADFKIIAESEREGNRILYADTGKDALEMYYHPYACKEFYVD